MNTFLSRLNSLFAWSLSVTAAVTFACFLTTHFINYGENASIEINKVTVKNIEEFHIGERMDLGHFSFSLKANLTSVFNWNCKELFIYLLAEYETPKNKLNQVVLWDFIINRGENAVIDVKKISNKYYFFDDGSFLRGTNMNITLNWNVIPNAGYLWRVPAHGSLAATMPQDYTSRRR